MLFGLLTRRVRWSLSSRGWITLLIGGASALVVAIHSIYPFLALTVRARTDVLAVEGWIADNAIEVACNEFQTGSYRLALSTGGPFTAAQGYSDHEQTAASLGAHRLVRAGLSASVVHSVPCSATPRDRTYHSAVALREWLYTKHIPLRALNVVTDSVHARRTRLLYQAAFGPDVSVGVIAVSNPTYDGGEWWRYSAGVRDVVGEAIAYLYAKFFFFPVPPDAHPALAFSS